MVKSELTTGQYTIVNAGTKNAAQFATSNEGQKLQASTNNGSDNFTWQITKLANGHFLFKNIGSSNWAYVDNDAAANAKVVGSSSKREWVVIGTGVTDEYNIAPNFAKSIYWGLDDDENGAVVKLDTGKNDDNNKWFIKKVGV